MNLLRTKRQLVEVRLRCHELRDMIRFLDRTSGLYLTWHEVRVARGVSGELMFKIVIPKSVHDEYMSMMGE